MPHSGKASRGRTYVRLSLAERFEPKVDRNGPTLRAELGPCHAWTGSVLVGPGYGCIRNEDGKTITAHLAAWLVAGRLRPGAGRMLCHRCDNRTCVNVAHLFEGTAADNIRDAVAKGRMVQQHSPERMPRGSRHHQAKLTEAQVREIRRLAAGDQSLRSIAAQFGVSDTLIGLVVKRKFWRHVA
jgi:hypothetical protein